MKEKTKSILIFIMVIIVFSWLSMIVNDLKSFAVGIMFGIAIGIFGSAFIIVVCFGSLFKYCEVKFKKKIKVK